MNNKYVFYALIAHNVLGYVIYSKGNKDFSEFITLNDVFNYGLDDYIHRYCNGCIKVTAITYHTDKVFVYSDSKIYNLELKNRIICSNCNNFLKEVCT